MNELIERLRSVKWEVSDESDRMPDDPTHKRVFVDMSPDDFRALLLEAADALEAAREDGWQPIETAPRDGVEFLSVANYTDEPRQVQIVDWDFVQQCQPGLYTHWTPLPELPMQDLYKGEVVVTRNESGEIVPRSRQDSDECILSLIAEAAPGSDAVTGPVDVEALRAGVEYEYEVWQDGALQAGGRELDYASAQSEANHYAMMYSQDGPVEVRIYEKRLLTTAQAFNKIVNRIASPPAGNGAKKGVVAWARPVYARPVNAPETDEWDELVDVVFHTRPEKPEGDGWYPLVVADTGTAPRINVKCETADNGITGATYLKVIRVEQEDDGSLTAVIEDPPLGRRRDDE